MCIMLMFVAQLYTHALLVVNSENSIVSKYIVVLLFDDVYQVACLARINKQLSANSSLSSIAYCLPTECTTC